MNNALVPLGSYGELLSRHMKRLEASQGTFGSWRSRLFDLSERWIWTKRHGPWLLVLLKIFGLIQPLEAQNRLDVLDPRLVCETLVAFEQFQGIFFLNTVMQHMSP